MNWNKGFSAEYYASVVDPATWRDIERFEIIDGDINRKSSDLMESASISVMNYNRGEIWVRIWLDVRQAGASERVALFTGLTSCPKDDIDGYRISNKVDLYSVLKVADDVLLERGWYCPAGFNVGHMVQRLLSVTPAPCVIDGETPALQNAIIAESGESNLSMAWKLIKAVNWRIRIDGDGTIHVCPQATEVSARYDALDNDAIEPKMSREYDWYSCPNVFRAVVDEVSAVARDDSPDSPLSTVNRGREIWMEDTSCDLAEGESIADYAVRRLKEEQRIVTSISYDRRYNPDIRPSDLVNMNYPEQKIVGTYRVESHSVELTHGARTSEEAVKNEFEV